MQLCPNDSDTFAFVCAARPRLIICDGWLRHHDQRWTLLERLWSDPTTAHTPVIVCISDTDVLNDRLPLLHARRGGVRTKPCALDEWVSLVRNLLAAPPDHPHTEVDGVKAGTGQIRHQCMR